MLKHRVKKGFQDDSSSTRVTQSAVGNQDDLTCLRAAMAGSTNQLSLISKDLPIIHWGVEGGQIFGFDKLLRIFRENA